MHLDRDPHLDDRDHVFCRILELGSVDIEVRQLIPLGLVEDEFGSLPHRVYRAQVCGGVDIRVRRPGGRNSRRRHRRCRGAAEALDLRGAGSLRIAGSRLRRAVCVLYVELRRLSAEDPHLASDPFCQASGFCGESAVADVATRCSVFRFGVLDRYQTRKRISMEGEE